MADRFTYLPSIGLFIAVVWGSAELLRRWRVPAFVTAGGTIVLVGVLVATSHAQLAYWRDGPTLFAHALNVPELAPRELILGNIGAAEDVDVLARALGDEEPLVRAHTAWALQRTDAAPVSDRDAG